MAEAEIKEDNVIVHVGKASYEKLLAYQGDICISSSTPIASIASASACVAVEKGKYMWIIDSIASTHLCGNRFMFLNFNHVSLCMFSLLIEVYLL